MTDNFYDKQSHLKRLEESQDIFSIDIIRIAQSHEWVRLIFASYENDFLSLTLIGVVNIAEHCALDFIRRCDLRHQSESIMPPPFAVHVKNVHVESLSIVASRPHYWELRRRVDVWVM